MPQRWHMGGALPGRAFNVRPDGVGHASPRAIQDPEGVCGGIYRHGDRPGNDQTASSFSKGGRVAQARPIFDLALAMAQELSNELTIIQSACEIEDLGEVARAAARASAKLGSIVQCVQIAGGRAVRRDALDLAMQMATWCV